MVFSSAEASAMSSSRAGRAKRSGRTRFMAGRPPVGAHPRGRPDVLSTVHGFEAHHSITERRQAVATAWSAEDRQRGGGGVAVYRALPDPHDLPAVFLR